MNVDETVDHFAFAIAYAGHVDFPVVLCDAKLFAPLKVRRDLCAVNDVFAGKAGYVRTGATDVPALNDCYAFAGAGQCPRDVLSCFTAAEDDYVVFFDLWHKNLRHEFWGYLRTASSQRERIPAMLGIKASGMECLC